MTEFDLLWLQKVKGKIIGVSHTSLYELHTDEYVEFVHLQREERFLVTLP